MFDINNILKLITEKFATQGISCPVAVGARAAARDDGKSEEKRKKIAWLDSRGRAPVSTGRCRAGGRRRRVPRPGRPGRIAQVSRSEAELTQLRPQDFARYMALSAASSRASRSPP